MFNKIYNFISENKGKIIGTVSAISMLLIDIRHPRPGSMFSSANVPDYHDGLAISDAMTLLSPIMLPLAGLLYDFGDDEIHLGDDKFEYGYLYVAKWLNKLNN